MGLHSNKMRSILGFPRLPGDSELEDRIKNEEAAVIVAEQGGKYAGCIVAYPNGKEIHFGPFAVKPEFQGKGVGRFLLAKVEGLARERGFESVGLEIVDHRTDLVAFYEKLGFKLVGSGFFPPEIQSRLTRESKYLIYEKKLAAEKK